VTQSQYEPLSLLIPQIFLRSIDVEIQCFLFFA